MAPCCGLTPDPDGNTGYPIVDRLSAATDGRTRRTAAGVRGSSGGLFLLPKHLVPRFLWRRGTWFEPLAGGLESSLVELHDVVVQRVDHLAGAGQQRQEVLREERRHRDLALIEGLLGTAGTRVERRHGHRGL